MTGDALPDAIARLGTGTGVDVHAWDADSPANGRELWLGGLCWPGQQALAGHSDADVAAHALCDALFSAAGIGDLGAHFGVADPAWAGSAGTVLLAETARRVRASGYEIVSASVQVVGRRPRLGPRRAEAEAALGQAAGCRLSVSATTTDGLGFTGRDEGVAAVASALVWRVGR